MNPADIAEFLGISEETAKDLIQRGLVPGRLSGDEWDTTLSEIEDWYASLNGQDWANLVNNGRVDPLSVYIDTQVSNASDKLVSVLSRWEGIGLIRIIVQSSETDGSAKVVFTLHESVERGRQAIRSLPTGSAGSIRTVLNRISLTYQCEVELGAQPVIAVLTRNGLLELRTEDDLGEVPQRNREIMRLYLSSYAFRVAADIVAS